MYFQKIISSNQGEIFSIPPSSSVVYAVGLEKMPIGLGFVEISVTVNATDVESVTEKVPGFLFFFYIISF